MTDENIPAVADEPTLSSPSDVKPASTHVSRSMVLPLIIALLAFGLAIGLAVAAYFTWHQVEQLAGEQSGIESGVSERIQPLRTSLDAVSRTLEQEKLQLEARISRLGEDQQSVGHRLNVLAALMGRSERGWTLAEVEYLLRIANQRLQLQRDLNTAGQALDAADERLRELADPHYLSVREQIARDRDAIKAVPVVDTDGLSVKLTAALKRIDELPVTGTRYEPVAPAVVSSPEGEATAKSIDELATLVWTSLSELFRLREHDRPVEPMLPPEREYFLRENLRLQLAAARLALLRNDTLQYSSALQTAEQWLGSYFESTDTGVQHLIAELNRLARVDISPVLPDVSASLRLLRQQIGLSEQQAVLPVVPEKEAAQKEHKRDARVDKSNTAGQTQ
jgi:uroporphyrin-III C-methyltransferase